MGNFKRKNVSSKIFQNKRVKSKKANNRLGKVVPISAGEKTKKIRLVTHSDDPRLSLGFGVAMKGILQELYKTGRYEIHCIGVNNHYNDPVGIFEGEDIYHYAIPFTDSDPWGITNRFPQLLQKIRPDVVLTLNDLFVLNGNVKDGTKAWYLKSLKSVASHTPWVLYFPIDSDPITDEWAHLAYTADKTVVYSKYAYDVLKKKMPEKEPILIPHGTNIIDFHIIEDYNKRQNMRRNYMNVSEDEFLVGMIARNQPRKNPAVAVEIFKMANEGYYECKDCNNIRVKIREDCEYCGSLSFNEISGVLEGKGKLYLHMHMNDNMGLNMYKILQDNDVGNTVIYSPEHSVPFGLPIEAYNEVINAFDCQLMPTTSEGYGLCLHPDSLVQTSVGLKYIKDVSIGDNVLTHKGTYGKVLDKTNKNSEKLFKVKVKYRLPIKVTKEHPFLIMDENSNIMWKNVAELSKNDLIASVKTSGDKPLPEKIDLLDFCKDNPNIEYDNFKIWNRMGFSPKEKDWSYSTIEDKYGVEKHIAERAIWKVQNRQDLLKEDSKSSSFGVKLIEDGFEKKTPVKINRFINIDDKFLEFIGWYIAEGSTRAGKSQVEFSLHRREDDVANRLGNYAKQLFDVKYAIYYRENKCSLSISSDILVRFLTVFCGRGAHNKKIPDIFSGCEKSLGPLIKGYLLGDGYINFDKDHISYTTVSKNLVYQIPNILSSFGVLVSIKHSVRKDGSKPSYSGQVPCTHLNKLKKVLDRENQNFRRESTRNHKPNFTETDSYFFLPIENIDLIDHNDNVYDLCVENSHSFVANGLVVHNTLTDCMCAGVVNIATRTSAVTELLEDGRGHLVIPKGHLIFKDAANTHKMLIDERRAIEALGKVYQDWKNRENKQDRWGAETKKMIDKGLEFCKQNTWEKMGKLFDQVIQDAINERVQLSDVFNKNEEKMPKVLFSKNGNAGDCLQVIPSIMKFREKYQNADICYAMPSNLIEIFEGRYDNYIDHFIPLEKMSADKQPEKGYRVAAFNMTGVEASYERGAYPLIQHSREELYSFNAGMGVENVSLDGAYELTSEEVSVGKKLFEDQGLDLNEFTVALCGFSLQPNKDWGKDDAKWVELEKFIKKMKLQIAKMQPEYSLGENLGMLSYCSLTVTPDNDLLDFLAALELPSISLLSPHWKTRVKNYKNTTIVSADEALARGVSEEPFNVMQFSALMESISTSNVFSKILIYLKNWKNSKLEQQQELEIVANE